MQVVGCLTLYLIFLHGIKMKIQFQITYSTADVEFNTTMALVVLIERCNFVIAGTETIDSTDATGHFPL